MQLLAGWAVLTAVWIGLGALLTGPLAGGAIVRTDMSVARWFVVQRTVGWNHATVWGSLLAETTTKVAVTTALALAFLWHWRRWLEPLVLVLSLVIEAAAFIVVTTVVGRHRPDVVRLDGSPVGSSFPSGHTAAAAAYAAIVVVLVWHTRRPWARGSAVVLSVAVTVVVACSRMYRGMHFLTDTIAGAVLGGASVALTTFVLATSPEGAAVLGHAVDDGPATGAPVTAAHDRIAV
jgi:undecaprenyl-diphosphatase